MNGYAKPGISKPPVLLTAANLGTHIEVQQVRLGYKAIFLLLVSR
jgi:hypothetical protein